MGKWPMPAIVALFAPGVAFAGSTVLCGVEEGGPVRPEARVGLGHGEVADAGHRGALCAGDGFCGFDGPLRGAGVVVLAGQEVDRASGGVDLLLAPPKVPVDAVKVGVATIDAGT